MVSERKGAMKRVSPGLITGLCVIGCMIAGIGCAQKAARTESTAEDLFRKGMRAYTGGKALGIISTRDYHQAAAIFQELLDKYPYSRYAPEAHLRLADSYFHLKEYESAILIYDEFQRLRPSHPEVPYALFQLGECYFRQILSIDRDQSAVINAQRWFEKLVSRFPESRYASEAGKKISECRTRLAERELYVGKFYLKRGDYFSALERFERVMSSYPHAGLTDRALYYAGRCYRKLRNKDKADEMFRRLQEDYPDSSLVNNEDK